MYTAVTILGCTENCSAAARDALRKGTVRALCSPARYCNPQFLLTVMLPCHIAVLNELWESEVFSHSNAPFAISANEWACSDTRKAGDCRFLFPVDGKWCARRCAALTYTVAYGPFNDNLVLNWNGSLVDYPTAGRWASCQQHRFRHLLLCAHLNRLYRYQPPLCTSGNNNSILQ